MSDKFLDILKDRQVDLAPKTAAEHGRRLALDFLNDGLHTPVDGYVKLRYLREVFDAAARALESAVEDEIGDREYIHAGVSVQHKNGYALYDYSDDGTWGKMKEAVAAATAALKDREKYLKALQDRVANLDTGEVDTPARIKGYSKSSIAISAVRK